MVDGYLEKIYVPEGANVTQGQLLLHIKNPVYDEQVVTAKPSIRIAQADVDAAKMDVEKVRPLRHLGQYPIAAVQCLGHFWKHHGGINATHL